MIPVSFKRPCGFLNRHEQFPTVPTVLEISSSRDLNFFTIVGGVNRHNETYSATTPEKQTLSSRPHLFPFSTTMAFLKQETFEITAGSLDEARAQVKGKIPHGFFLLSETVVSDGRPVTIRESAETTEQARTAARSKVPSGHRVEQEKETRHHPYLAS